MAVNLAVNVRHSLAGLPIDPMIHCWLDSAVALHWINSRGDYRQFVANRVSKVQKNADGTWRHVPTTDNPADIGSRGGSIVDLEMWWKGPIWLALKVQQELFAGAVEVNDDLHLILEKWRNYPNHGQFRKLTKRVLKTCWGCKRFRAKPFSNPPTAPLPTDRTQGSTAFDVIGVDFAGPITYRRLPKKE